MNPKNNYDYSPLEPVNTKVTYRLTFRDKDSRTMIWVFIVIGLFISTLSLLPSATDNGWPFVIRALIISNLVFLVIGVVAAKSSFAHNIKDKALKKFLELNKLKPYDYRVSNFSWLMFRNTEVKRSNYKGFSIPLIGRQADIINYDCQRKKHLKVFEKDVEKLASYYFTVIGFKLSRQVPDIIIEDRSTSVGPYEMRAWLKPGQILKLEGDFNDSFTVYVPEGYEQDALFILTPELMGNIMDYGKGFSFEIVDSYLYIFRPLNTKLNPVNTQRLVEVAEYFSYEFEQNTREYRDERVDKEIADDGEVGAVSELGRRLKTYQD
ncbi:MAG: hypothetical protein ABI354_03240 [Candidatus Saccharimonadales bacterium]